jgi:putative hydrolase of the HAD superfamily
MEALIFDLDDTLVADEVSATSAFLKTCLYAQAHYGINLPGFHATIREICRSYWHQSPAREYCLRVGISSWEGLWAEFDGADENLRILRNWAPIYRKLSWLTTLQRFGIDDEAFALKLADKYIVSRRELHVIYRDVVPALEAFKSRYRLGLLTNGAPDLQRRKIAGAGIGKYFDAVVVSGEVGIGKPDTRVFEMLLSRLNVAPESALMVGDSLKSDIQGAHAVGMKAAWVNRSGKAPDSSIIPDFVVNDLDELGVALNPDFP